MADKLNLKKKRSQSRVSPPKMVSSERIPNRQVKNVSPPKPRKPEKSEKDQVKTQPELVVEPKPVQAPIK
jgi:hypothetical protein